MKFKNKIKKIKIKIKKAKTHSLGWEWISLLIKLFLMDFSGGSGFLFSKTGIRVGEE